MYTMKEVCQIVGWSYETLKYYCKEGLIPNVKRDKNNYRVFDENNIEWIKGLQCLKKCGMSLKDMRMYLDYCMQGPVSIPERVDMLNETKEDLERRLSEIQESLDYIEQKKELYGDGIIMPDGDYRLIQDGHLKTLMSLLPYTENYDRYSRF